MKTKSYSPIWSSIPFSNSSMSTHTLNLGHNQHFSHPKNINQNFLPIPGHKQEKLDNIRKVRDNLSVTTWANHYGWLIWIIVIFHLLLSSSDLKKCTYFQAQSHFSSESTEFDCCTSFKIFTLGHFTSTTWDALR